MNRFRDYIGKIAEVDDEEYDSLF